MTALFACVIVKELALIVELDVSLLVLLTRIAPTGVIEPIAPLNRMLPTPAVNWISKRPFKVDVK